MKNKAKDIEFFISKSALGKIFYLMVLGLYAHYLCKNAENRLVVLFLSQTFCEIAVSVQCFFTTLPLVTTLSFDDLLILW